MEEKRANRTRSSERFVIANYLDSAAAGHPRLCLMIGRAFTGVLQDSNVPKYARPPAKTPDL